MMDISNILQRYTLKDTKPRRSILQVLDDVSTPLTKKEIYQQLKKNGISINLVTIYRIIQVFEKLHIIHQHPSSGAYSLCSHQQKRGHHVLLSCHTCGQVKECIDADLCKQENRVAHNAGFTPKQHISEIIGICFTCSLPN